MSSACRLTTLEPNPVGSPPVDARTMHSPSDNSLIELRGFSKQVSRGIIAVHGMALAIWEGGIVSLVGLSVCGKNTLLEMIAGLLSQSKRTDTVNGRPPA